eukprot:g81532.t1
MVEDSVGYSNLELLLNAEMQRQSLVASKLHNLSPPPGGTEPRLFTVFPYEKEVDWLSLLHTFGCLCHVVLDKKYHGLRKEEDRSIPAAWMGLDLETSAHIVLVQGEIKRWRDVINFDEDQPAWPIILQIWKACGLKLDEALGYKISDDMEELFVKPEGGDDSDRVVVVKEEKEEEGKLRSPEPEESTEELREGLSLRQSQGLSHGGKVKVNMDSKLGISMEETSEGLQLRQSQGLQFEAKLEDIMEAESRGCLTEAKLGVVIDSGGPEELGAATKAEK